jgi:hypothetical protein
VIDLLNTWKSKSKNLGKKCAVDITSGKKSLNSCISIAASNVTKVDLYYMDFHGNYNKNLKRPMFMQSFLAHLPHSELAAGSTYLKRGKDFFKVLSCTAAVHTFIIHSLGAFARFFLN